MNRLRWTKNIATCSKKKKKKYLPHALYKLGAIQFKNFIEISKPMKHAAFAGKARSITGTTPL